MKYRLLIIIILAAVISGWLLFREVAPEPIVEDSQPAPTYDYEYGEASLEIGKTAKFPHVNVTALEVTEDSRCPVDVQCIWAGTVKVKVNVSKPSGNFTEILELGKFLTTGTELVTLVAVSPSPKAGESIAPADYRLVFRVSPSLSGGEKPETAGCYIGGCSGQICSDEPGAASTCEFRAEYSCYKTAKCERQAAGECGWTETPTLKMCLANPPALQ